MGKTRELIGRFGLALWIPLALIPGVYLLANHLTTLPAPDIADPKLAEGLAGVFPSAAGSERVVHMLYERCGCSSRVAANLLARGPRAHLREGVIMIDDDEKGIDRNRLEHLRASGFMVATLSTERAAERLHLLAVPLLVVIDRNDRIRYAGGYTLTRDTPQLEDARIVAEVDAGRTPTSLPVFGCAVATNLQKQLDPLGFKY